MDELLQKIINDLDFVQDDLRHANSQGTAIESLVILPLIKRATELRMGVNNLIDARTILEIYEKALEAVKEGGFWDATRDPV